MLEPVYPHGVPAGYHSVTPRIVVGDPAKLVQFLQTVFDATGDVERERPTEVRIGDSIVMISSVGERGAFPAFRYVYVADVDEAYRRALAAGATSIEEPANQFYGDRRAMVADDFGNHYQIAHRTRTD
jgi:PhnB protein